MAECSKCGKTAMTFTCRYCDEKFCSEHRLPENHDCTNLDKAKSRSGEKTTQSDRWFKEQNLKQETVRGQPKKPVKSSITRDIIDTLKNNYTLAIIAVTTFSFALQFLIPGYTTLMELSPALSQAAIDATTQVVGFPIIENTFFEQPWTLVTLMIVHGGAFHLFANMVTFYFFGTPLEKKIGGKELLKFYVFSGVVASLAIIVFSNILFQIHGPGINGVLALRPIVGASGAVVAVFAAVAMLYPDAEVLLYFFIPMKIKTALQLFAGIESVNILAKLFGIALPLLGNFGSSAHLAGLAVGLWYGKKLREKYSQGPAKLDLLSY